MAAPFELPPPPIPSGTLEEALLALVRRQLSHDADSVLPPSVVKARGRATLLSDWHKQKKAGKLSARPQTAHGVVAKLNFSEKLDHRLAEQRAAWAPKPVTSAAVQVREALCDSSSRAIDLFRKWDADDSGTITKREWRRALPMLGLEISAAQSDAAFDALDPSDDGAIDYAELGKLLRRGNEATLDAMLDEKMLPVAEAEAAAAAAEAAAAEAAAAEAAAAAAARPRPPPPPLRRPRRCLRRRRRRGLRGGRGGRTPRARRRRAGRSSSHPSTSSSFD